MKKLLLILFIFPVFLLAQQPGSFKIAKPQPKMPQKDTIASRPPFYFLIGISDFRQISSASDLYKVNPSPKDLRNRFDLNFYLPRVITLNSSHNSLLYAKTGITICALPASSNSAYGIPLCGGFQYAIRRIYFYADAGPQFFFPSADEPLSGRIVFDWGGGIGYLAASLNSTIYLGYRRLGNINMEGVSILILL